MKLFWNPFSFLPKHYYYEHSQAEPTRQAFQSFNEGHVLFM